MRARWRHPRVFAMGFCFLVSLACCRLPLVSLLGYESAALFGVLGALLTLWLTAWELSSYSKGPLDASFLESPGGPLGAFLALWAKNLTLLPLPMLVLGLNAFVVPNCDLWLGVKFWVWIPVVSILIAQTLVWAVASVVQRSWRRVMVALGLVCANAVWFGLRLMWEPPINGHLWVVGYFNGSLYDEALGLPASLVWYRIQNVLGVACVVWSLELWRTKKWRRWLPWVVASGAACAGLWAGEQEVGIAVDRETIAKALGGRVETEHFVIHYPATERFDQQLQWLLEDHEFRYAQMKAYFGTDPVAQHGRKVRSFVYPDREVKGFLMGARRTLVAKLWLHEIHIMWGGYGDHLLAHELAHVFTEPFGSGPLRLSMFRGIGVNMGLVEGIATAADWPAKELSMHEAAAALRRLELAPDIRGLVGAGGFWKQASGRAYTLMGSFVRHLVETRGMEAFKRVYGDGDFVGAYGASADELVGQWEAFVDGVPLSQEKLGLAAYLYRKPSIFKKVCPRTIAELGRLADLASQAGQTAKALALVEEVVAFDPERLDFRLSQVRLLERAGRVKEAGALVDQLLAGQDLVPAQRAQLLEVRGDLAWVAGQLDQAQAAYASCQEEGVLDATRRLVAVKQAALMPERAPVRALGKAYLLENPEPEVSLYYPMRWAKEMPQDPVGQMLVGRRLWAARKWEEALPYLTQAAGGQSLGPELVWEVRFILGQSHMFLGHLDAARELFEAVAAGSPSTAHVIEATEWLERVSWRKSLEGRE